MNAPEVLRTERLHLRRPRLDDVDAIYAYASDASITRYMAWPTHTSPDDTAGFLAHSSTEWDQAGVGAYLICDPATGAVLGGTGLHLETPYRGVTGYILVRAAWGQGYATEACRAMVELGRQLGLARVEADCHVDHRASARVLMKTGMLHEGVIRAYLLFPNLDAARPCDVHLFGLAL